MRTHTYFDATVDFSTPDLLELYIARAISDLPVRFGDVLDGETITFGIHIPAEGQMCERAEVTYGENTFSREISTNDWIVTGQTLDSLAAGLRARMQRDL